MQHPIIIYLDSQDFSKFSDVLHGKGDLSLKSVLDRLFAELDAGRVVAPVSMGHISELIQYERGGRDLALRKAATIERISRTYAFRYVSDLLYAEYARYAAAKGMMRLPDQLGSQFPLARNWHWHPTVDNIASDIRTTFDARFEEEARNAKLNRKQRREAKSALAKAGSNLQSADSAALTNLMREYPLSDRFIKENMLVRYLAGAVSTQDFEQELFASIAMPTRFVVWYFEKFEGPKGIPVWMRNLGEKIITSVEQARSKVWPAIPSTEGQVPRRVIREAARNLVVSLSKRFLEGMSDDLKRAGLSQKDMERLKLDAEIAELSTLKLLGGLMEAYIADNLRPGDSARNPRRSDGGDIIHALYLPHAHIWRCDAYFSKIAATASGPTKTQIVGHLKDLPSAIDAAFVEA